LGLVRTKQDMENMRAGGKILAQTFREVKNYANVGVTTQYLNDIAHKYIIKKGASPSFLGYNGFPCSICVSVNEEVVHGIPSMRILKDGDILSVDIGVYYEGVHTDMALTIPIGIVDKSSLELINITKKSLFNAIAVAKPGNTIGDIGFAVQNTVEKRGFSIVRDYVGHGIGKELHEHPQIPNFGIPKQGVKLVQGMTLAIEPMVNIGKYYVRVKDDGWTVVTQDMKRSAHFEHTVLVTKNGGEILTKE
jgi:methionyl aminopeptidase